MKTQNKEFWITNISNRNVSLADLNLTVKAFSSVNLLDSKHYHYSLEEIEVSVKSGSIYKKRDKIFVRAVAPEAISATQIAFKKDERFPDRHLSLFEIKQEKYEELDLSDEEFANENSDLAEQDRLPSLINKTN
jgi:hypothetical protein